MTNDDNIKVGDLVKRIDPGGSGTGILYRVMKIAAPSTHSVLRRSVGYNRRVHVETSRVKLKPVVVMFEAKQVVKRAVVNHFLCELQKVSLIDLGIEYVKLAGIIRDEARALGTPQPEPQEDTNQGGGAHREPTE